MATEIDDRRIIEELIAINRTLTGIAGVLAQILAAMTTPPPTPADVQIKTGA